MKATELRIGNIISDGVIKTFWERGVHVGLGKCLKFEDLQPIPLTWGGLVKLGFKRVKSRSGVALSYKKKGIRINISNSGNLYYGKLSIYSVHQLQNLYFALTGTELEIKD